MKLREVAYKSKRENEDKSHTLAREILVFIADKDPLLSTAVNAVELVQGALAYCTCRKHISECDFEDFEHGLLFQLASCPDYK